VPEKLVIYLVNIKEESKRIYWSPNWKRIGLRRIIDQIQKLRYGVVYFAETDVEKPLVKALMVTVYF
jgi:hypothetical protein